MMDRSTPVAAEAIWASVANFVKNCPLSDPDCSFKRKAGECSPVCAALPGSAATLVRTAERRGDWATRPKGMPSYHAPELQPPRPSGAGRNCRIGWSAVSG